MVNNCKLKCYYEFVGVFGYIVKGRIFQGL